MNFARPKKTTLGDLLYELLHKNAENEANKVTTKTKVPERTLNVREETFDFAVALVAHYTRFYTATGALIVP